MGAPSHHSALRLLARAYGIRDAYLDADGRRRHASDEALLACLGALGLDTGADPRELIRQLRQDQRDRLTEPVVVSRGDERASLTLGLDESEAAREARIEVGFEDGRRQSLACRAEPDGRGRLRVLLPWQAPYGYHEITVEIAGRSARVHWIAAPVTAHPAGGDRSWGLFMPTYALRSARSTGGVGDLADLGALMDWTADRGGSVVSTLPLLSTVAGPGSAPGPYRPDSRLFWNETYLALDREPLSAVGAPNVTARTEDEIEFHRLADHRQRVLDGVATIHEPLRDYLRVRPEVEAFARHRAARGGLGSDWRRHAFAQWAMELQLAALKRRGLSRGVSLALDLPVGVHPDGYDAWRYREQFVAGVCVGAPPDAFFVKGQDWGVPAPHPHTTRLAGHRYFADCLRQQMRFASILRIDHVMSLHRLFWVPSGFEPAEGVYVRYPARELHAVVALESCRSGCAVVGEDLGTVAGDIRPALARERMRRTFVLALGEANDDVPAESVASLATHDMPTFAGWWQGGDLADRVELGLLSEDEADSERSRRELLRAGLTDDELLETWLTVLARSPAGLAMIQLEDLWLETRPQNVPGTSDERPNFRRPARESMEQFMNDPRTLGLLHLVDDQR